MAGNSINYHDVIDQLCVWMSCVTLKVSKKDVRDQLIEMPLFLLGHPHFPLYLHFQKFPFEVGPLDCS